MNGKTEKTKITFKEWENKVEWHGKAPTKEEGEMSLKELRETSL